MRSSASVVCVHGILKVYPLYQANLKARSVTSILSVDSLLAEALFLDKCSLTGEKRPLPWIEHGFDLTAVHDLGRVYYNACSSRSSLTAT